MIRLILVDDQENIRQGLRMRLALEADLQVIGEANNGEEAIALTSKLHPDVIIMDVEMPIIDGISAAQIIHEELGAKSRIVVLSIHNNARIRERAFAAGAAAYVEKHGNLDNLLAAIRSVANQSQ